MKYFYFKNLDLTKEYTYADYVKWTFEEMVELIKGGIFRMAAPLLYAYFSSI